LGGNWVFEYVRETVCSYVPRRVALVTRPSEVALALAVRPASTVRARLAPREAVFSRPFRPVGVRVAATGAVALTRTVLIGGDGVVVFGQ
jgi:hypothetical protein